MKKLALLLVAALGLPACAEMSGAQKGALVGAGTGAAAGAIIGNQVKGNRPGHAGTGAIIGALGGAAAGALIGDAMEQKKPAPPQPGGVLQPVPPPGQPAAGPPPPTQASVTVPGQYAGDPTRGQLINGTPFLLKVYMDVDPTRESSAPYLTMNPNDVLPVNLDVGAHRVVAIATRDTQFGPRTVGRLDRPLRVEVRGSGWELRFTEGDFR
ncbi:MAG: glycine zipper 2TM domain-containing protein [candidate division NC10 bacterium]|nr:glycine zipper 2TM domain-containing protein [candidate division NC10 bacterium]